MKRGEERMSFEKEGILIDLILRITLVMEGGRMEDGMVREDRMAEWSEKEEGREE